MDLGEHPERFGLEAGDRIRTTKQYDKSTTPERRGRKGVVHYFSDGLGGCTCAWIQWANGDRELLGCAWIEKYAEPIKHGELTNTTIEDVLG